MKCSASMLLGVDALDCTLPAGHKAPHRDSGFPLLWTDLTEKKRWNQHEQES